MENKKRISLDEIYPAIKETLENGGTVELPITGTSMFPLLKAGRDTVIIKADSSYNVGDIIFYRRNDGHFVLHRIVGTDENGFILCGDNQTVLEKNITEKHIIAKVTELHLDGKVISADSPKYIKWVKLWIKALPRRKLPLVILRKVKKTDYRK